MKPYKKIFKESSHKTLAELATLNNNNSIPFNILDNFESLEVFKDSGAEILIFEENGEYYISLTNRFGDFLYHAEEFPYHKISDMTADEIDEWFREKGIY